MRAAERPGLALGIAIIALVAAAGIVLAAQARFYGPAPLVLLAEDFPAADDLRSYAFDEVRSGDRPPQIIGRASLELPHGDVTVRGWAAQPGLPSDEAEVLGLLDDAAYVHATSLVVRPDVANALGTQAALRAGYEIRLRASALRPGRHALRVALVDLNGRIIHRSAEAFRFTIK